MHGRHGNRPATFQSGTLKGRENSSNLGIDGNMILKWILNRSKSGEAIHSAQNRKQ
jgi:hypothetical protein